MWDSANNAGSAGHRLGRIRTEARQGGRGHRGHHIKELVFALKARGASKLAVATDRFDADKVQSSCNVGPDLETT